MRVVMSMSAPFSCSLLQQLPPLLQLIPTSQLLAQQGLQAAVMLRATLRRPLMESSKVRIGDAILRTERSAHFVLHTLIMRCCMPLQARNPKQRRAKQLIRGGVANSSTTPLPHA
jgi:hypothetical protein